jgi:hypothetical protein
VPDRPERIQLDLAQFKALDLKLNGINGAINKLSDNTGKWLSIIAEALGGTDPELQKKIDALAAEIGQVNEDLAKAIQPKTKEQK